MLPEAGDWVEHPLPPHSLSTPNLGHKGHHFFHTDDGAWGYATQDGGWEAEPRRERL
jgi:hypothetical protein